MVMDLLGTNLSTVRRGVWGGAVELTDAKVGGGEPGEGAYEGWTSAAVLFAAAE